MIRDDSLRLRTAEPLAVRDLREVDEGADGELVVVQPAVLATVDHAFGNLFQRLYHLVRTARSGGGQSIQALDESLHELQSLLELFVDYVAPTAVQIRSLSAADLLLSLRQHLEQELGPGQVRLADVESTGQPVAADPARITRVFQLLAHTLRQTKDGVRAGAHLAGDESHIEITVGHLPAATCATDELRRALARKLIELQGGELRQAAGPDGIEWILRLPVIGK